MAEGWDRLPEVADCLAELVLPLLDDPAPHLSVKPSSRSGHTSKGGSRRRSCWLRGSDVSRRVSVRNNLP